MASRRTSQMRPDFLRSPSCMRAAAWPAPAALLTTPLSRFRMWAASTVEKTRGDRWHRLAFPVLRRRERHFREEPCVSGAASSERGKDGAFTGVFTVPLDALGIDMVELRRFLRGQDLFERIKGEREGLHLSEVGLIELGREDGDAILSCRQRSPGREATAGKKGTVVQLIQK